MRLLCPPRFTAILSFQSTHPRGVRPTFVRLYAHLRHFNPRTREGCDLYSNVSSAACTLFQSTHPRGVRRCVLRDCTFTGKFQSTHPRGVRPDPSIPTRAMPRISIHAPARGATMRRSSSSGRSQISIHAPARGATEVDSIALQQSLFQSTHPRGVRLACFCICVKIAEISIHAPARGATCPAAPASVGA